ncbi:MAG TPA: DEAD/DEAH box helicase [Candidatus Thermoplasmatota archaeon]|nr:DEAD/DEAH box helicase [Candidatus Thermoplasmatota archaeon]
MPKTFDDLGLSDRALDVIHKLGWRDPTWVQAATIPQIMHGRDVIARAQTGSGKTGAFGFPLTERVKGPGIKALVLAPTRELVVQVTRDLNTYAEGTEFRAVAVYGGVPYEPQIAELRDPATTCIVATPGRLLDLLARKSVSLDDIQFLIMDEADRMLDYGFLPEVERVIKFLRGDRQTAIFSATLPKQVAKLALKYMANPREIHPDPTEAMPESAEHFEVRAPSSTKGAALIALLQQEEPTSAIVFVRTRESARDLEERLRAKGLDAVALHGDLKQAQREEVFGRFRAATLPVLVATDVAARGLDVTHCTHVVNYDLPEAPEDYVHRAGRTARAGRPGRIFSIVTEKDEQTLKRMLQVVKVRLSAYKLDVPDAHLTPEEVQARRERKKADENVPARYRSENLQSAEEKLGTGGKKRRT